MVHSGAIVQVGKLAQVVGISLLAGIGITTIFSLGISSAAGLIDALRDRRTHHAVAWGTVATICAALTIGAIVLGIVVMTTK